MIQEPITMKTSPTEILDILEQIGKRIAPAWPLKNMVAVNPFHGYSKHSFEWTARYLSDQTGIQLYMPLSFYQQQIKEGVILDQDIQEAISFTGKNEYSFEQIRIDLQRPQVAEVLSAKTQTIADFASEKIGLNYNLIFVEGVTSWASMYFQEIDNPSFPENKTRHTFQAWKQYALIDRSPIVAGIQTFKKTIQSLPDDTLDAIRFILDKLPIPESERENYMMCLTHKLIGWSSYISGYDWDNQLYTGATHHIHDFISILLSWELCIYQSLDKSLSFETYSQTLNGKTQDSVRNKPDELLQLKAVLQTALDLANQRILRTKFGVNATEKESRTPDVQAIFCIDVRSEVFRRNLEATHSGIQTLGFAGFFGFPIKYERLGFANKSNLCPVLLPAGPTVSETANEERAAHITRKRISITQFKKSAKKFRKGPVSSFGFVSPLGLFYLPKLISDSFGLTRPVVQSEKTGYRTNYLTERKIDISGISFSDQLKMASGALRNMGLTSNFAPLVLLTGHGSSSVNNPHAGSLECGACGGHSGDINALTAATILNDKHIRRELQESGIQIPEETIFLAGFHNTTTDQVELLNKHIVGETHLEKLNQLLNQLKSATATCNAERVQRFNKLSENSFDVEKRSRDWSQTRPEWGLAGCNAFIIGNRLKTKGIDLNGQSFLHDYDFGKDIDLSVLESILTAPMIVTSWINLQYYASTVEPKRYGAGNKTLHNITSTIGVIEGSGGDLRIGLPLQSVSRGNQLEHIPQRLTVVIDAPTEAIERLLKKHESVKALFDNQWIYLLQLDGSGNLNKRYKGDLKWESLN